MDLRNYGDETIRLEVILTRAVGDRVLAQLERDGIRLDDVLLAYAYHGTFDHFLQHAREA